MLLGAAVVELVGQVTPFCVGLRFDPALGQGNFGYYSKVPLGPGHVGKLPPLPAYLAGVCHLWPPPVVGPRFGMGEGRCPFDLADATSSCVGWRCVPLGAALPCRQTWAKAGMVCASYSRLPVCQKKASSFGSLY